MELITEPNKMHVLLSDHLELSKLAEEPGEKLVKIIKDQNDIIKDQDRMIGELTRKASSLQDTVSRSSQWRDKAKKDAGYDRNETFDRVWEEILAMAKGNPVKGRRAVIAFANVMEEKLKLNDEKSGWMNMSVEDLNDKLVEEYNELQDSIHSVYTNDILIDELADVANFCMMIHDNLTNKFGR